MSIIILFCSCCSISHWVLPLILFCKECMKDYKKILEKLDPKGYQLIEHEWGQNSTTIYNRIAEKWNRLDIGKAIFVVTRKKYGLKSLVAFLISQGLECVIVGKGRGDVDDTRMIEIIKTSDRFLSVMKSTKMVEFSFRGKTYHANVGNAVFSKTGLDKGTEFLLSAMFEEIQDVEEKMIGDVGAGWGAISLILATEFPGTRIIAFEKEIGAFEACRENFAPFPAVKTVQLDITDTNHSVIGEYRATLDYVVSNFSFHVTNLERERFFQTVSVLLKPQGEFFFVAEGRFVARCKKIAEKYFDSLRETRHGRYTAFICR